MTVVQPQVGQLAPYLHSTVKEQFSTLPYSCGASTDPSQEAAESSRCQFAIVATPAQVQLCQLTCTWVRNCAMESTPHCDLFYGVQLNSVHCIVYIVQYTLYTSLIKAHQPGEEASLVCEQSSNGTPGIMLEVEVEA